MPRRRTKKISSLPKDLATPIELKNARVPSFARSEGEVETITKSHNIEQLFFTIEEAVKKIPLLYKHYGLNMGDNGSADTLVMRLAIDYVPGFWVTYPQKRGRKNVWHAGTLLALWVAVQEIIYRKKCSERTACNILVKSLQWKQILREGKAREQGTPPIRESKKDDAQMLKTLYNHYLESKKSAFVFLVQRLPKGRQLPALQELCQIVGDPTKMTFDE